MLQEENMDPSPNTTAKKRVQRSILLGLGSIIGTPLVAVGWIVALLSLHPGQPDEYGVIVNLIFIGLLILCAGMGMACVVIAFTTPKILGSWQGKAAVILAVLVALLLLPYLGSNIYSAIFEYNMLFPG
jgi:hypothetical protein